MTDAQNEPTLFDALRDGSLLRRIFAERDASTLQPPAAPPSESVPGPVAAQPAPPPHAGVAQPQAGDSAPAARPAFRFAVRLSGGWLVLVVLAAFGIGFVFGARWQTGGNPAGPPSAPVVDLSPQKQSLALGGQTVIVTHSALDIGSLPDAFDGNPDTLMRGAADNPFLIEIEFPEARALTGLDLTVATMTFFTVDVTLHYDDGAQETISGAYENLPFDPTVSFTFPQPEKPVQALRVEIEDIRQKPAEGFHIHVRELVLR